MNKSFIIIEDSNSDRFAERVTEFLNAGYELHGESNVVVPQDAYSQMFYTQAVVKHDERKGSRDR